MFEIIKDNQRQTVDNRQGLSVYLANGWKLVKTTEEKSIQQNTSVSLDEVTKKELQSRLEAKGIEYNPRDSKTQLLEKLGEGSPTDNFDDGLLKG
jgi:hypothetical protein